MGTAGGDEEGDTQQHWGGTTSVLWGAARADEWERRESFPPDNPHQQEVDVNPPPQQEVACQVDDEGGFHLDVDAF